ncbi:MAG TPA: DinB family protein [Candidatus Eisenbacteria bacterium]|nr:DinB family protein [Candidatus Eisenbacteria bacterium]
MKAQQALAQQFGFMYRVTAANLEGMTREQSLVQPPRGGNCANWILGHVTNVQNGVMELLGQPAVWQSEQLARAGYEPIQSQAGAIDWDTMRDRFLGSSDRCVAAISALSDPSLAEEVPHPFGGTCTRGELLTTLAFHQTYHAGQLAMCRRIAGLEGAIKAPGQRQTQKASDSRS